MENPFDKESKRFSVIVPVYKFAYETFGKFFQALNEQSYKHFEVIVSFDGPNKKGLKELDKMTAKYPKMDIKYTVNEWGGAPSARNHGARMATGDYLTFLDPDIYPYPESFRQWADAFENNPTKNVVWGLYEVLVDNQKYPIGGSVPTDNVGNPVYWAFRFSNYCSGAFPIRREAFVGWDESVKSLQDWDMWQRMLLEDNFEGKAFHFIPKSFFVTENVREGGISHDSHNNWIERVKYVREKNGIPISDTVVCSLGAPWHGINAAKILGADYLPMPSYKPHTYKKVYLLGFYANGLESHLAVFEGDGQKSKKILHWIGTDIFQLSHNLSVATFNELKKIMKRDRWINLTEAKHTHKEMKELGIKTKVVPIPPSILFHPAPLPEEFTVAIYENPNNKMYREELMQQVVRSMPDIKFIFFGDDTKKGQKTENSEHLGWVDITEVIAKSSCNLRITVHDGLPLTPLQFMTAGRQVITNTDLYGATVVKDDLKEITEAIRQCKKQELPGIVSAIWFKRLNPAKYRKSIGRL